MEGLDTFLERMNEMKDHFIVERIPPKALKALSDASKRASAQKDEAQRRYAEDIPQNTKSRLYPFQREGVQFGLKHGGRLLLADEMGLGKTVQAICIALAYHDEWPLLVVCPSAVRQTWEMQLKDWLPDEVSRKMTVINQGSDIQQLRGYIEMGSSVAESYRITIVSYDLAQKLTHKDRYKVIICDESHHIKTLQAQRTQFLLPVLKKAKRVILVSGTPALSRPIELFPQIEAIRPGILGTAKAYGDRYCRNPKDQKPYANVFGQRPKWQQQLQYRGSSYEKELHTILKQSLLIRRLKKDVLKDLPSKIRRVSYLQLTPAQRIPLDEITEELDRLPPNDHKAKDAIISAFYRATGPAKLPALIKALRPLVERATHQENGKLLIFAHHKEVLDGIEEDLLGSIVHIRIDGSTSSTDRAERVNAFQTQTQVRVALLSILAGGVGITLTAARTVAFGEITWTPGDLIQAEDRAHRVGQTWPVEIYYFLAPGSADELLWATVRKKLGVVGESVDGAIFKEAQKRLAVTRSDGTVVEKRNNTPSTPSGGWGSRRWDPKQLSLTAFFNVTY